MEEQFLGTAKIAKLDRKIQELRDKIYESSDQESDENESI